VDGDDDVEALGDELGDELGEVEGDADGEGDAEGDDDAEEVASAKLIHDIAPSSPFVAPVQVRVAVPAVVVKAVVKRNVPASMSRSSVALAQVFPTVSVAPAATAKKPPPVGMVFDPVVSASVASMSVDWSAPVVIDVSPAPTTR
jgi:hypothetical protein